MVSTKKPARVSAAMRFSQIERISIMGITERMGPLGLHMYANAYLDAARVLPVPIARFELVRPFLVCHAIELALKAFLSLQGTAMLELADGSYGHNLDIILEKADENGLGTLVHLTKAHKAEIRHASVYYAGKVFEYPAVGEALSAYPSMPTIDILFEAATVLIDSLRKQCREAK